MPKMLSHYFPVMGLLLIAGLGLLFFLFGFGVLLY